MIISKNFTFYLYCQGEKTSIHKITTTLIFDIKKKHAILLKHLSL